MDMAQQLDDPAPAATKPNDAMARHFGQNKEKTNHKRCPQDEYTPHFKALMIVISHLDLPVAYTNAMFQLAVPDLGLFWNFKEQTAHRGTEHRECLETLERVCPGCMLRWTEPTKDFKKKK